MPGPAGAYVTMAGTYLGGLMVVVERTFEKCGIDWDLWSKVQPEKKG